MRFHLLFAPLVIVFLVLNALGGIVSGVWLAILGHWWAIGVGLLGLLSPFFLSLVLMPGMLLGVPAMLFQQKGRVSIAVVFAGVSSLYVSAIVGTWGAAVLIAFLTRATSASVIPLLIWSYGVATGPWAFLASKDQQASGNEYSAMSLFFLQLGYVVAGVVVLTGASFGAAALCILGAMSVNWILQMVVMGIQMQGTTGDGDVTRSF